MANKKFTVDILSQESIKQLQRDLELYKNSLVKKCQTLVNMLASIGINTAQHNTGSFGKYISFSKTVDVERNGCKAIMLAVNTGIIRSEWQTLEGVKTADVSPLLMVEFGSGTKAQNPMNVPGVGQGTFPGQTHAFESGWWYMDLNNEWHYTSGVAPKMPMYKAVLEMRKQVVSVAREVFK